MLDTQSNKRRYIDSETVASTPQTFTAAVIKKDKYGQPYKDSEATITFDLVHDDGEYTYAMLILKDEHYLGKGEFEAINSVLGDGELADVLKFRSRRGKQNVVATLVFDSHR